MGHPPGAPFFMIVGRLFALMAPDAATVAMMINIMSALSSAFTILFLFWTITHLASKIFLDESKNEPWRLWAVMGSGLVGALAYTFSDTFWFSAVEGEVYAMSSLFTAIVFWSILKWENESDTKYANRWIILIAYLMGLSIGVHLLNLLAIPAIVLVYYFKKYEVTTKGLLKALGISAVILLFILYGIIPYTVKIASWFELLFVNGFGLPYNSGVAVYFILLVSGLIYGLWYSQTKGKVILNTILLSITVILIGYSSFAMIIIRSSANPTMDQNSPEDVFSMMGYLNREQYGDRPLFVGQYFSSPIDRIASQGKKGEPIRIKKNGKYEIVDYKPKYVFNSKTTTIFPRMYSREGHHIEQYKMWSGMGKGQNVKVYDESTGKDKIVNLPTFIDNIVFFFNYQVKHMYFRYFMWNFAGRQNDIQGNGGPVNGNWISGIPFLDNIFLGDQSLLPDKYKNNKAHNKYYMLPLLLGIMGLFFQLSSGKKGKQGFWIVFALFFLTGLAIVLYLNQTPLQPRERDYAYAGSFYAFAIWIGLGVLAIIETTRKYIPNNFATISSILVALISVPGIMAAQNWDDHDRSGRFVARDLAFNYLDSCDKNAILFTNGDNDTFPLWYAQEVEGYRTDVRVCNLSYLQTDWYIDQMKRKSYKSPAVPFSLTHDKYVVGKRDLVYLIPRFKDSIDMKRAINFLASENPKTKEIPGYSDRIEYLPANKFFIPVDKLKVIQTGLVNQKDDSLIVNQLNLSYDKQFILKNELMVLDLLSNNNWNRPIYFAVTVGRDNYVSLDKYFQLEGFTYKVVPIETINQDGEIGKVDTEKMYDRFMNKFRWGGMDNPDVYLDENHRRMAMNIRNNMARLASALINEGKKEKAINILNLAMTKMPNNIIPHNYFSLFIAEQYYRAGLNNEGDKILSEYGSERLKEIMFFGSISKDGKGVNAGFQRNMALFYKVLEFADQYKRSELTKKLEAEYKNAVTGIDI